MSTAEASQRLCFVCLGVCLGGRSDPGSGWALALVKFKPFAS